MSLNKYELVKQQVSMPSVIGRYGFELNRSGFISCPFHSEKTASMKIYDKSFYCFGCGAGGDVIKFVSLLFRISAPQAVVKLSNDFFLGLKTDAAYDKKAEREYALKKLKEEQELQTFRQEYMLKCEEFKKLRKVVKKSKDFIETAKAQARLEYLDYWFSENHWR